MDNKKSISDIEISERREHFNNKKRVSEDMSENVSSYKTKNKKIWPSIFVIFAIIIVILMIISFAFHSSEVRVKSKTESITFLNDVYTGVFSDGESVDSGEVKQKSIGKIRITNKTKSAQTLRKDTRFQIGEDDSKIVYKIFNRVTIKPEGNVIAEAYSDGFGEKYNRGEEQNDLLKIPGFKEAKMEKEYSEIFGNIEEDFNFSDKVTSDDGNSEISTLGFTEYEVITVSSKQQEKISSVGIEEVFRKAKGKIRIINKTNKNQKLRKETRFENNGLVFKTYKSVTIPSNSSVIADAFADEAGRKYNIEKDVVFSIPGFKEAKMDEEYSQITGVAYTNFIDGMVGKVNIPNKEEFDNAKISLLEKNSVILKSKIQEHEKKEDYIFLDSFFDAENIFTTKSDGDENIVIIESMQKIPLIKKKNFIAMILNYNDSIKNKDLDYIKIKDLSELTFKIINVDNLDVNSENNILFSINGNAKISWIIDEDLFITSIKGNSMDEVEKNLKNSFKNFEFNISVFPFWRSSVPKEVSEIDMIIEK